MYCGKNTKCGICSFNIFVSVQYRFVNAKQNVVQQTSGNYPPYITETLYMLISSSLFPPPLQLLGATILLSAVMSLF